MSLIASSSRAAPLAIPLDAGRDNAARPADVRGDVLVLFDACAPAVRRYVLACGIAPHVADDIVQETFVALFQHLRRGGRRDNLHGWVMQVGYRLALKHRRQESRRGRWVRPWGREAERVCDRAADPENACAARQVHGRVHAVLKALPERDRRCVHLRAEGLRYREIATVLGISLGAVAKSLARAVSRVAAVVE